MRFLWLQAETTAKRVRINKVPGPENVADANTKLADRRSLEFRRMSMGVTQIPQQFREAVQRQVRVRFLSLCHAHTRAPRLT